jgi:acetylornithine deacetylase/succinyl-diaminopimelate desuccinylase-like protein
MPERLEQSIRNFLSKKSIFQSRLLDFLRIPSISTDPKHEEDMCSAAEWVKNQLLTIGFQKATLYQTQRHPVVFGYYRSPNPEAKTLLIYGHYDVQPPDPLELWVTPPFEPTIRNGNLFARGASDMKGQTMACLNAIDSILSTGDLSLNIKVLVEGEEEIGSPNLPDFIQANKNLLACDFILNPDAGMVSEDLPTIVYALRGLAYFELRVYGPAKDLHSGVFGGIVHNPAQALCELIAGMKDGNGRITLPGFYDSVRSLSPEDRKEFSDSPMDDAYYLQQTGAPSLYGEKGYSPAEQVGARPTLEVNGLYSGFTGTGSKTVIPAWAMAKISTRLVADQDPKLVHSQLLQYLKEHAPETIRWELIPMQGGKASFSDRNLPATKALAQALEKIWGKPPLYKREGGSVPVVVDMQNFLGVDSTLTGFGLPNDNVHSPNEKLNMATWYKGTEAIIHFLFNLAHG